MTVEITDSAVRYLGRDIAGADVDTFETLALPYARDGRRVYLLMASKAKPLPQPDPATFESLGEGYGRDAEHIYYLGKRVRLKKGPGTLDHFRPIGYRMATDGHWLYFETKQVTPPNDHGLDLSVVTYRHFADAPHYFHDGLLSDGHRHWLYVWNGGWRTLRDVDATTVGPLGVAGPGLHRPTYVSDGTRVFFLGEDVAAALGKDVQQVGWRALAVEGELYAGTDPTGRPAAGVEWLQDDDYRFPDGDVWRVSPDEAVAVLAQAAPPTRLTDAARALLDAILPTVASLLDRYAATARPYVRDADTSLPPPKGPLPFELLAVDAEAIRIWVAGTDLSAAPDGLYGLACAAWAASRSAPSTFVPFVNHSTSYPDVDAVQQVLAKAYPVPYARYSTALQTAGATEASRALTHLVARAHRYDHTYDPELLTALPPGAGELLRRSKPYIEIERTSPSEAPPSATSAASGAPPATAGAADTRASTSSRHAARPSWPPRTAPSHACATAGSAGSPSGSASATRPSRCTTPTSTAST